MAIGKRYGMTVLSPLGKLSLLEEEEACVELRFADEGLCDETPLLLEAKRQLAAYFAGELRCFTLPLRPQGTTFQVRVWEGLQQIPYGQSWSYLTLAETIGAPRAMRAVGGANGKNPLPILIPCHRVIRHDGALGGYSGGLSIKRALLDLEGVPYRENDKKRG